MRKLRVIFVLVFGLLLAGTAVIVIHDAPQPFMTLADGSILRVEQVNFGSRGTFRLERGFERLKQDIAKQFPKKLGERLAKQPAALATVWEYPPSVNTNRDALHIWFTHRDATGKCLDARYAAAIIVDEHGCIFDPTQQGGLDDGRLGPLYWAASNAIYSMPRSIANWFRFDAFPRAESLLAIKVIGEETNAPNPDERWRVVADFAIRNPKRPSVRAAGWKPEPLPISKTSGDGTLVLEELKIADRVKWSFGTDFQFAPILGFQPKSSNSLPWIVTDLVLSDSAGNQSSLHRGTLSGLCFKEPAWKLTGKFLCPSEADAGINTCWIIPNLRVPGRGEYTSLGQAREFGAAYIKLIALTGAGRTDYSNETIVGTLALANVRNSISIVPSPPKTTVDSVSTQLALVVSGLGTEERVSVLVIDDQGRRTYGRPFRTGDVESKASVDAGKSPYLSFAGGREKRFVVIDLPEESKTVDLEVWVHHARTVEFVFKPPGRKGGE